MAFVDNARRGMLLFGNNVLPILFPFFFISSLLIELDIFKSRRVASTLSRNNGTGWGARVGVTLISFLSGSPTGARMLSRLYERGEITRAQAIKTATYTSTTSPIFIIATVGAALYGDVRLGIIIFAAHILGALINGLVYNAGGLLRRFTSGNDKKSMSLQGEAEAIPRQGQQSLCISDAISKSLYSSAQNIMAVGGLIVIFFIAAAPFGMVFASILEITTGIFLASESSVQSVIIPCAIVSFGGLCVAMQSFVFLKSFQMPVWFYFLYKATHTFFAVAICTMLTFILL